MLNNKYSNTMLSAIFLCGLAQPAAAAFDEAPYTDVIQLSDMIVVAEVDADEVWKLKEAGTIMSLEDIIRKVRQNYSGRIIEIEIDEEDGRYVYEMELVDEQGVVWDLDMDATTGEVLEYEQDD